MSLVLSMTTPLHQSILENARYPNRNVASATWPPSATAAPANGLEVQATGLLCAMYPRTVLAGRERISHVCYVVSRSASRKEKMLAAFSPRRYASNGLSLYARGFRRVKLRRLWRTSAPISCLVNLRWSWFPMDKYPNFDPSQATLPDEYLIAIGRVSYIWGVLESSMDFPLAKLSGLDRDDDPRPAIMVTHMSWPQRMDTLETFVSLLSSEYEYLQRFSEVKPILKKAQEGRNRIVHARWGRQDSSITIAKMTARGKLKVSIEPISVQEIDSIFNDIGIAGVELIKLILNK
jgi:hypothetical protein